MTYKLLDLWMHAQLKKWMSKRGLAVLDQKIAKLPIAVNRSLCVSASLLCCLPLMALEPPVAQAA
jgi:hypothetical protein